MDHKFNESEKEQLNKRMQELEQRERRVKLREDELERRSRLFDMQWKILEHELLQLAGEKERFNKEKAFYYEVKKYNKISDSGSDTRMAAKMFFLGVRDELSLKKRYRDLLKLFHPDSMNGDVHAMQAINKEYEEIKRAYDI